MNNNPPGIYLDYAAATPVRNEVISTISETITHYANPSSIHKDGMNAREMMALARKDVALSLNAHPDEIIFTSGSTEGLNISIQGVLKKAKEYIRNPHVITSSIEHPAILETLRAAELEGARVTFLMPNERGVLSLKDLEGAMDVDTVLVALSFVNSEIGNTLDVEGLAKVLRSFKRKNVGKNYPYFLLDATQAAGVFNLNVGKLGIDLMTVDGSKIGGLKGSGALFVSRGVEISPILFGGGQEGGLRPGTANTLSAESLRVSLVVAQERVVVNHKILEELSGFFISELKKELPLISINGDEDNRAPHIVSVCFPNVDAEWIVLALDARGVRVSRGSACKSGKGNESEILRIIRPECSESSVRFSFGEGVTKDDLKKTVSILKEIIDSQTISA